MGPLPTYIAQRRGRRSNVDFESAVRQRFFDHRLDQLEAVPLKQNAVAVVVKHQAARCQT
jgi:hypothetical protein